MSRNTEGEIRRSRRLFEQTGAASDFNRYISALNHFGGLPYWTAKLSEEPANEEIRHAYCSLGGVWARLVQDPILGPSIFMALPYEGKNEKIVVGLKNLEIGHVDTIESIFSSYIARAHGGTREKGVIAMPLRLETAGAVGMHSIRDMPLFKPEVDAYRTSFQEAVETTFSSYGYFTYGRDTQAVLNELTLDGRCVQRDVVVPFLYQDSALLAPAQAEESRALAEVTPDVKRCIEELSGSKNPADAFQCWASRVNNGKREIRLWTPPPERRTQDSWLGFVLLSHQGGFGIGVGAVVGTVRGARRVKDFPT